MTIEVNINKYLEALNNKIIECEYFFTYNFNKLVDRKFNGFFNTYIFKKSLDEIIDKYKNKIYNLHYGDDNYELSSIKRHYYNKLNTLDQIKDLNNIITQGTNIITINESEMWFLNQYATYSNHMKIILEKNDTIKTYYCM